MKKVLITGITGQDGSYLAELLLHKGYEVHGIVRHVALEDPDHRLWRIKHIASDITLHSGSLESYASIFNIIGEIQPDELYHLAAQSFVSYSFEDEFSTVNANINGTMHVLSALKKRAPHCKLYFAGSSEMFGKVREVPQNELTPFHPRSPYGISKVAGFEFVRNYREAYGMFACNGMLFNHESPRRGYEFVTRKITSTIAQIVIGEKQELVLGNMDAKRDWGFAADYVVAMWMMLQQENPDDFVVGTGETYSVRNFVEKAFDSVGVTLAWEGKGVNEIGRIVEAKGSLSKKISVGDIVVRLNKTYYRPSEVELLISDYSKAKKNLGWEPKMKFNDLVEVMMQSDLERMGVVEKNTTLQILKNKGFDWILKAGE